MNVSGSKLQNINGKLQAPISQESFPTTPGPTPPTKNSGLSRWVKDHPLRLDGHIHQPVQKKQRLF